MSNKIETLAAKIATAETKLAELKAQHASLLEADAAAQAAANIQAGQVVRFSAGRGDKRAELEGKVLTVVETDSGKLLKVLAGEGAATKLYDVPSNKATVAPADGEAVDGADIGKADVEAKVQEEANRTGEPQPVANETGGVTVVQPDHSPVDPADILG